MNVFLNAAIMAFLAALATTSTTVMIEKFGGVIGGVFGSYPTTLILASIGMLINLQEKYGPDWDDDSAASEAAHHEFETSMFTFPVAILVTTLLVILWQQVPPRLTIKHSTVKGLTMLAISLVFWLSLATGLVFLLPVLDANGVDRKIAGGVSAALYTLIAFAVSFSRYVPAPRGKKKAPVYVLFLRGIVAGMAIFVGVVLSRFGGPTVGGIASVFPAVFLTTMMSIWLSQGELVVMGATNSLMLGFVATSIYCFVASFLCFTVVGFIGGVVLASLAALLYSVVLGFLLQWRQKRLDTRYSLVAANSDMLSLKDIEATALRSEEDSPRVSEDTHDVNA